MDEKLDIVDDIMVKKDYHQNICDRYNIGTQSIRSLQENLQRDPTHLRKQHEMDVQKQMKEDLILEKLETMIAQN